MTISCRGLRCLVTSSTWLFALLLAFAISTPAHAKSPTDATDRFLKEGADFESDSIADEIVDDLKSGKVPKGKPRDAIKSYVKGKLEEGLKQDVQSAGMQAILGSISDELKKERGDPCQVAAMRVAYGNVSDPSSRRVIKGAGNTFVDIGFDVMTGGSGKARKLAETSLAKLGKKLAENGLKEIEKRIQDSLKGTDGGIEVYRAKGDRFGCDVSIAVFWNKVTGKFRFMIAGDCKCKVVANRSLSRWSVTGSGSASYKNGKPGRPFVFHTKGVNSVFVVKAICCSGDVPNRSQVDPWKVAYSSPVVRTTPPGGSEGTKKGQKPAPRDPGPPYFVKIPEIPTGPVCAKEKARLLKAAEDAQGNAERNRAAAANEKGAVLSGLQSKPPTHTQGDLESASDKLRKANRDVGAASDAVRDIYNLKVTPKKCDKHSSLLGWPGVGYAGTPADSSPSAAALRSMRESVATDDSSSALIYVPSGFDPALADHHALVGDVREAADVARPNDVEDSRSDTTAPGERRNPMRAADSRPSDATGVEVGPSASDFRTLRQRNVPFVE